MCWTDTHTSYVCFFFIYVTWDSIKSKVCIVQCTVHFYPIYANDYYIFYIYTKVSRLFNNQNIIRIQFQTEMMYLINTIHGLIEWMNEFSTTVFFIYFTVWMNEIVHISHVYVYLDHASIVVVVAFKHQKLHLFYIPIACFFVYVLVYIYIRCTPLFYFYLSSLVLVSPKWLRNGFVDEYCTRYEPNVL